MKVELTPMTKALLLEETPEMSASQFNAFLFLIVPYIVEEIIENRNLEDEEVISIFYKSKLYSELSDEKTKLWHYSPKLLYRMFQDELLTGTYDYPEEA